MKKLLIPILFAISTILWAEMGPIRGAGITVNLDNTVYSDTDADGKTINASSTLLTLQPSLHFFFDESTEFVPFLTFRNQSTSNPDDLTRDAEASYTDGIYRLSLGGGASLLWHFLKTEHIGLVTGLRGDMLFGLNEMGKNAPTGDAGDPKKFDIDLNATVPLAMDFILTKQLTLRFTGDLVCWGYTYTQEQDDDTTESTHLIKSSFPFLDDSSAAISLAAIYYVGNK